MMDQRELETRVRALMRSVNTEPAETSIALLETLKKEAHPTEEMLRATKAGVIVNKLRSNANRDLAKAAGELVQKWKKLVEQEKSSRNRPKVSSPTVATPQPGAKPSTPQPSSSSAPSTSKRMFAGDPERRNFKNDKIDTNRTSDPTRNNLIGMLYNGLAYRSTEPEDAVLARAIQIEDAANRHFRPAGGSGGGGSGSGGPPTQECRQKLRSLVLNLKSSNRELGRRVMSGDISAERFVAMTGEELKSDEQKAREDVFEKENMKRAQVPAAERAIADGQPCRKCKSKKVTYTQAQTRSADEPMTTFFECTECGTRWKE